MTLTAESVAGRSFWNMDASGNAAALQAEGAVTVCAGLSDSLLFQQSLATAAQGWAVGGYAPLSTWTPSGGWAGFGLRLIEDSGFAKPSFDPHTVTWSAGSGGATITRYRPSITGSLSKFPCEWAAIVLGDQTGLGNQNLISITLDVSKLPAEFRDAGKSLDVQYVFWGDPVNGGFVTCRSQRVGQALQTQDIDAANASGVSAITDVNGVQAGTTNINIYLQQHEADGDQSGKTFDLGGILLRVNGATEGLVWLPLGIGSTDSLAWSQETAGGGVIDDAQLNAFIDVLGVTMVMKSLGQNDTLTEGNRATLAGYESALVDRWMAGMTLAGVATPRWVTVLIPRTTLSGAELELAAQVQAGALVDRVDAGSAGELSMMNLHQYYAGRVFVDGDVEIHAGQGVHYSATGALKFAGTDLWAALGLPGCHPPGLRLYDQATGLPLAGVSLPTPPATAFAFDLAALGLAEGDYVLGVSAVDAYGCESAVSTLGVLIDGVGSPALDLVPPQDVVAEALAGGVVAVSWAGYVDLTQAAGQVLPAEFEVAEGGDLATVLATVGWNGARVFRAEVGPFADGASVTLNVRAIDGVVSGLGGPWVAAAAVVADAVGPVAAVIDEGAIVSECGCE